MRSGGAARRRAAQRRAPTLSRTTREPSSPQRTVVRPQSSTIAGGVRSCSVLFLSSSALRRGLFDSRHCYGVDAPRRAARRGVRTRWYSSSHRSRTAGVPLLRRRQPTLALLWLALVSYSMASRRTHCTTSSRNCTRSTI